MKKKSTIFFDGYCILCSRTIQFIIKHDSKKIFQFVPIQSDVGQSLIKPFNISFPIPQTVLLLENNHLYKRSAAVLKIIRQLDWPIKYLYFLILVPAFLRDGIYCIISKHRYTWFGQNNNCYMPTVENLDRFL